MSQTPSKAARPSEAEGCALLKARFEAAGYAITEGYRLQEGGVDVSLDGFDPARRVGYELITTSAGDRVGFTPAVVGALEASMSRGELFLFLVDELDVDADALVLASERFLARLPRPAGGAPR